MHDLPSLLRWRIKCSIRYREDRKLHPEENKVTKNVKGLLEALRQSINESIMESNDVAAAMAALTRTGASPVFAIDVMLEEMPEPAAEPLMASRPTASSSTEELVLSDDDVAFLAALGISDPSWASSTTKAGTA
jgi:hypothetical protein